MEWKEICTFGTQKVSVVGQDSENSAKPLALPTGMSSLGLHLCPLVSPSNNPRTQYCLEDTEKSVSCPQDHTANKCPT